MLSQGISCPEVFGDPVLLFPLYYNPSLDKKYKVGIVLHFLESRENVRCCGFDSTQIHFISVKKYGSWKNFIDEVCMCDTVLSSSLHGCIVADAYNIPNLWTQFTDYVAEEDGFKFRDYYLSTQRNIKKPIKIATIDEGYEMAKTVWTPIKIDLDLLMSVCPFKSMNRR